MSITEALAGANAKPAGKRPYFLDREVERVLAITMAIAQELAVTRQRLDTLERVLADHGLVRIDEIENFAPAIQAATERALWTQEYLARILRIVAQENESAARGPEVASEDVGDHLGPQAGTHAD